MPISNLSNILASKEFQAIPAHCETPNEFIELVIPKGYENTISASTDGIDVYLKTVNLTDEVQFENQLMIKKSVYDTANTNFPTFLFSNLKNVSHRLNQNQVLHLIMIERFEQFKPMSRPYLNLLGQDIKGLLRYIDYDSVTSYNAKVKIRNSVVVIPFKDILTLSRAFTKTFLESSMSEQTWNSFFNNQDVLPSSLGSMTSSSSVVLSDSKDQYRSPAYKATKDGFYCIFKEGPNVPARLQTHLLGNAINVADYDTSPIQQDNIIVEGVLQPKDKTLRKALAVFHPIDQKTCRLMAGEIEISSSIADTLVVVTKSIEDNFKVLNVEEGQTYETNFKPFHVGDTIMGDSITVEGAKSIRIKSINLTGINGTKKIYYELTQKAGNARIISNTGVKGVTKVRNNLGSIVFPDHLQAVPELSEQELAKRYPMVSQEDLEQYKGPSPKPLTLVPDMVLGMNSAKGKSNTIVLAGACLAVELGFYEPKEKHGFKGLLNSLDEKEINEAYQSLPKFVYTNEFGQEQEVFIGMVYINYTELGSTYTKVKDIPFAFEAGRFLATDTNPKANELYKYIWDNYLEEDKIEAVKELYECYLNCQESSLNNPRNIPVYNLDRLNEIFSEKDLILSKLQEFMPDSKLLSEEHNPKGFFIDLSRFQNAPIIQIPSAKTLKLFSGEMKNGKLVYHVNVVNVSKILRGCLKLNGSYALNTVYSKNKERQTSALAFNSYMNTLRSTVFSGPDESQHLVQALIKPKITGCNLKQVAESWLPSNTVVILDKGVHKKLKRASLKGREDLLLPHELKLTLLANKLNTEDKEQLQEAFQELVQDCPLAMALRNPVLWRSQFRKVRVWDIDMFDLYLRLFHNLTADQIVSSHYNKDIILTSIDILEHSHGDADGDLLPLQVLDYAGQQILEEVIMESVTPQEYQWNKEYIQDELSGQEDFEKDHKYQLYFISNKAYKKTLVNASTAKGYIGPSTIDTWVWAMLLESYQAYFEKHDGIYTKGESKSAMALVTPQEADLLNFTYIKLLQIFVIMGIKHVQNGSKDFEMYTLNEIGKQVNETKIRQSLRNTCDLSDDLINKLFYIIRFANDNNDLIKGARNFVTLYNKGKFPKDPTALNHWEDFLIENTYFGSLITQLAEIKTGSQEVKEESSSALADFLNEEVDLSYLVA